jgi:hypothetical protein
MRIAFDLDGVLADLHTPFVAAAVRLFPELDRTAMGSADVGASPPSGEPELAADDAEGEAPTVPPLVRRPVTRRQADEIWRHLGKQADLWEGLTEIESGMIARLAAIADERRWEVIFVTSRPRSAGRTVQRQSQRWLERLGFPLPSVFVVHGSRGRVASALDLDVVVDDRPDNCLDVVLESKAGAVLIWRGPQDAVPASARRLGIAVAPTVARCLDTLLEADQSRDEGNLLDKLRRLFGLRTKSGSVLRR